MKKIIHIFLFFVSCNALAGERIYCVAPPEPGAVLKGASLYEGIVADGGEQVPDLSLSGKKVSTTLYRDFNRAQFPDVDYYFACKFGDVVVQEKVEKDSRECAVKLVKKTGHVIVSCIK